MKLHAMEHAATPNLPLGPGPGNSPHAADIRLEHYASARHLFTPLSTVTTAPDTLCIIGYLAGGLTKPRSLSRSSLPSASTPHAVDMTRTRRKSKQSGTRREQVAHACTHCRESKAKVRRGNVSLLSLPNLISPEVHRKETRVLSMHQQEPLLSLCRL